MLRYKNLISTTNLFSKLNVKTNLTNTETTYSENLWTSIGATIIFSVMS